MSHSTDLGVHLVTDDGLPFARVREVVDAAVRAGVDVIQLRDKHVPARDLIAQSQALAAVTDGRATLLINDRLDVALAARHAGIQVDGVHLGQDDVPVEAARHFLGPDATVGWTADTPRHLAALAHLSDASIDYLGVGVIRATSSKADHPEELGVEGFGRIAAASPVPCIAIGGVGVDDVPALRAAGAAGVAVVSAIGRAHDPEAAARQLVQAVRDHLSA